MILSIASQKGGVSKTTTSISLASGLAHKGQKVLLIDIDSQANSSKVLVDEYAQVKAAQSIAATIIDRQPLVVRPSNIPNLDVVPAHILLSNTDVKLTTAIDHREARLTGTDGGLRETLFLLACAQKVHEVFQFRQPLRRQLPDLLDQHLFGCAQPKLLIQRPTASIVPPLKMFSKLRYLNVSERVFKFNLTLIHFTP